MDVFPKYIIETDDEFGDCLILSKCTYHIELATFETKVKGGGWFRFNSEENSFTFHDSSDRFGQATLEDVKKCIIEDKVFTNPMLHHSIAKKHTFYYDTGSEIILLSE